MLILASASPRRQELLQLITPDFSVVTLPTAEDGVDHLSPAQAVQTLAQRKALAVASQRPQDLVIGADTLVALEHEQLGKPQSPKEAVEMLTKLSGRIHQVYTGVCVASSTHNSLFYSVTQVEFYPLTLCEIENYVQTGEPMDKAGSYGIQEQGALFVKGIVGDYYNVMGLPVALLNRVLQQEFSVPNYL